MQIIDYIGNRELLQREKTLFICSKLTPFKLYDVVFHGWTTSPMILALYVSIPQSWKKK